MRVGVHMLVPHKQNAAKFYCVLSAYLVYKENFKCLCKTEVSSYTNPKPLHLSWKNLNKSLKGVTVHLKHEMLRLGVYADSLYRSSRANEWTWRRNCEIMPKGKTQIMYSCCYSCILHHPGPTLSSHTSGTHKGLGFPLCVHLFLCFFAPLLWSA